GGLRVGVDYRPHCNLERLNAQVRGGPARAGTVTLAGARACGFDNRWGDGLFRVVRGLGPDGGLVRVRLDVGAEETRHRMRRAALLGCGAIVSRMVWDGGQPPRRIERSETTRDGDSGWTLFAGRESQPYADDAANFLVVHVSHLVERYPAFADVFDAPAGARFRLVRGTYVPD